MREMDETFRKSAIAVDLAHEQLQRVDALLALLERARAAKERGE